MSMLFRKIDNFSRQMFSKENTILFPCLIFYWIIYNCFSLQKDSFLMWEIAILQLKVLRNVVYVPIISDSDRRSENSGNILAG